MRHPPLATLQPAGDIARQIEGLWWALLWLGLLALAIFGVLLTVALRRQPDPGPGGDPDLASRGDPSGRQHRWWLVGAGVIQPAILIGVTFALTLQAMLVIPTEPADDALQVEVTAAQWSYDVRYPQHGITIVDELHIPRDQLVQLTLRSADVVHSFWVPQLVGKTDMLPDNPTHAVLHADRSGTYDGRCAEFCGLHHTGMDLLVVVHDPADFRAWVTAQEGGADG